MYKEGITKQEDEKRNKNICENKEDKELEVEVEKGFAVSSGGEDGNWNC